MLCPRVPFHTSTNYQNSQLNLDHSARHLLGGPR